MSKIRSFLRILKSPKFLLNVLLAILVFGGIVYGTMRFLDSYTLHGEEITVPDLNGLDKRDLKDFLAEKNLRFKIIDSIYIGEEEKGLVVNQNPAAFSKVKKDRVIYITVNSMNPPSVRLPYVVDRSMRQAVSMIESSGLSLGELIYQPDQCVNCVLAQLVNGKEVRADTVVKKGIKVDLVLGSGLSDEKVLVPFLVGMKREEVLEILKKSYLNLGVEIYDGSVYDDEDSAAAMVWKQDPYYSAESWLPMGSPVDIEYTILENKIDTINVNFDSSLYRNIYQSAVRDTIQDTLK